MRLIWPILSKIGEVGITLSYVLASFICTEQNDKVIPTSPIFDSSILLFPVVDSLILRFFDSSIL